MDGLLSRTGMVGEKSVWLRYFLTVGSETFPRLAISAALSPCARLFLIVRVQLCYLRNPTCLQNIACQYGIESPGVKRWRFAHKLYVEPVAPVEESLVLKSAS